MPYGVFRKGKKMKLIKLENGDVAFQSHVLDIMKKLENLKDSNSGFKHVGALMDHCKHDTGLHKDTIAILEQHDLMLDGKLPASVKAVAASTFFDKRYDLVSPQSPQI